MHDSFRFFVSLSEIGLGAEMDGRVVRLHIFFGCRVLYNVFDWKVVFMRFRR